MKSIKKTLITTLLIAGIAIQFFDVTPNIATITSINSIEKHYTVPKNVQSILKNSCYDCHSNNTAYPWYSNVQPVKWWLASHIDEGKKHLNFDEFHTYPKEKKLHKLDEVIETINTNEMPLTSYTIIHSNARLSTEEKQEICLWLKALKNQINNETSAR